MEVDLGRSKILSVFNHNSKTLVKLYQGKRGIDLTPTQTKMLLLGIDTIDEEANVAWNTLSSTDKREYSYNLGYGVYITVSIYRGYRYYDIRRWWKPPGSKDTVPTKVGLTLNSDEIKTFDASRKELYLTIPELVTIQPCDCWTSSDVGYLRCKRCNTFDWFNW